MNTLKASDVLALSFMTFALFIGAGNIIFPPFISLQTGDQVWTAALGFLVTAVGLPVITLIAIAKVGGSMARLSEPIGKVASMTLAVVCYLSIGPLFAGPRTAAVSFETGIASFTGNTTLSLFIYTLLYFAIVIVFSLYPGKLLDSVGRVLAPLKILSLLILGITVFVVSAGTVTPVETVQAEPFTRGFVGGYLTMDTLASLTFGAIIVNAIRSRKVDSPKLITRYAIIAGVVAGIGLALVYISLFKLGSQSGSIAMGAKNGAEVLHAYVKFAFGEWGEIFLGILIGIACLVTAIGVTTACGTFFSTIVPLPYRTIILMIVAFSFAITNVGLTTLLQVSLPMLTSIYPPCIVLVLLSFIKGLWQQPSRVFLPVMLVAFIFGIFDGLKVAQIPLPNWFNYLPLANENLAWLLPAWIVLLIATLVDTIQSKKEQSNKIGYHQQE